jgi:4-amino-4-deoxy-L-arabinose transferase-like glycosyltransferase
MAAVAILLRVVPVFQGGGIEKAMDPDTDSIAYIELADGLRHGCGFARFDGGGCAKAELDRTPGYPTFLAAFGNFRSALLAQALICGCLTWIAGAFAWTCWGMTAGLTAAALVSLDVPSIAYSAELMSETLFTACFAGGIILALAALHPERHETSRWWMMLAASSLLGYAVLTRPIGEFALLVPAILVLLVG